MIKRLALTASLISLTACASIIEGSTQEIIVDTNPSASVACTLTNERGQWSVGATPSTVKVKRSKSNLDIFCDSPQYVGQVSNVSDGESWAMGNVLLGGVIGAGVDAGTGALFSYDDHIIVPLRSKTASNTMPAATPDPEQYMGQPQEAQQPMYNTIPVYIDPSKAAPNQGSNSNLNSSSQLAPVTTPQPAPVQPFYTPEPTPAPAQENVPATPYRGEYKSQTMQPQRAPALPPAQF